MRRIAVLVGSRANYSSAKPICKALQKRDDVRLQVIAFGSALLDRYGSIIDEIRQMHDEVYTVATQVEGSHDAMVATAALTMSSVGSLYGSLKPDVVVGIGDRFEVLPAVYAAVLQNIIVCATMGGEISGTIDESIRHAVTKLAHVHCVATAGAQERLLRMGEDPAHVHVTGCPRIDLVREACETDGPSLGRCVLVSVHPVTTESEESNRQLAKACLDGAIAVGQKLELPVHALWPNADAFRDVVAEALRGAVGVKFHRKLDPETYSRTLRDCAVLIGNSSSGLREGAFLATNVVNVGSRQDGRERGWNASAVDADTATIVEHALDAIRTKAAWGSDTRYGDGHASERIVTVLAAELPSVQKRFHGSAA